MAKLKLWTVQPYSVWEQIRDQGEARVDPKRWSTPEFAPSSYDWLRTQLPSRLADYQGGHLWWFYCTKPDLRMHRHIDLPGGQHQVRLEVHLEPARVKVFRIWAWDTVYSGRYLGTRRLERDWRRRRRVAGVDPELRDWELEEPWKSELEKSWERIFEPLPSRLNGNRRPGGNEAVAEVIRREDVQRVDEFQTTFAGLSSLLEQPALL